MYSFINMSENLLFSKLFVSRIEKVWGLNVKEKQIWNFGRMLKELVIWIILLKLLRSSLIMQWKLDRKQTTLHKWMQKMIYRYSRPHYTMEIFEIYRKISKNIKIYMLRFAKINFVSALTLDVHFIKMVQLDRLLLLFL